MLLYCEDHHYKRKLLYHTNTLCTLISRSVICSVCKTYIHTYIHLFLCSVSLNTLSRMFYNTYYTHKMTTSHYMCIMNDIIIYYKSTRSVTIYTIIRWVSVCLWVVCLPKQTGSSSAFRQSRGILISGTLWCGEP